MKHANTNEFKSGDIVNFQAYKERKPIRAKVVKVMENNPFQDRVAYKLSGIDKPLVSITTGLSIVESKIHSPINEEHAFKY